MNKYQKQLNKISKALSEIPYKYVYMEIKTKDDSFTYEKTNNTKILGFRKGDEENE